MNLTKLFKTLLALLFLVGVVNAQVFYVNNLTGNDANPGTQALPKATVSSALLAAPGGSTISVAATGSNYTENTPGMNLLPGPLEAGVTGTYTFTSTGGTPVFTNPFQVGKVNLFNGATTTAAGTLTFTGPFQFNGLTLANGTLTGANNITISNNGLVTRLETGSIVAGGGQLAFAGAAAFLYRNFAGAAGTVMITGLEFPVVTNVATNLTLNASGNNFEFRLDQNRQINGVLNGDGDAGANTATINLNTFTLTINGANNHIINGNVTSATGLLSFNLTGNASLDANQANASVTNVTVGDGGAGAVDAFDFTLNPAGLFDITTVGNTVLNGNGEAIFANTGNMGNITHNGAGFYQTTNLAPGSTVGNVLMSSTATSTADIRLDLSAGGNLTTGSITQSGFGLIHFGANLGVGVANLLTTGSLLLNTNFVITDAGPWANQGNIYLDNNGAGGLDNITVNGTVTNNAQFSGTSNDAGNGSLGQIIINSVTDVNITGTSTVNITGSAVTLTGAGSFTGDIGNIIFAGSVGVGTFGAITNTSSFSPGAIGVRAASFLTNDPGTPTTINAAHIFATFAGGFTAGAVTNSSLNSGTAGVGEIELDDVTGNMTFTSITQSALALGGDIILGSAAAVGGNLQVNGDIKNERTVAGANIVWPWVAPGGGNTLSAQNIINSGASNIVFGKTLTGAVTINANLTQSGTGRIQFLNMTTAAIGITGTWSVSQGFLEFSGSGVAATGNVTVTGPVALTGGNIDLGNDVRTVQMSNASIQIGGNLQNVGWPNTDGGAIATRFLFTQPIPNVTQYITIGGLNQNFPGWIDVNNVSAIPAPYVVFQSLYGSAGNPGNLYISYTPTVPDPNGLVFNSTFGGVINTVRLDNVRLYVGLNNPGGINGGNFQNTTGYTTVNGGFVMMNGNGAQQVNATANPTTANVIFGNFGVDNNGGAAVTFAANPNVATFTADFYLAEGPVTFTNARFNGTAPNWPTVYRTEGNFTTVPTVVGGTFINVTYYGNDKATANETGAGVPVWNMTVATTNGASPGKGIVSLGGNITVNGTLTINTDQSLYTAVNNLTLSGATAVVNGYLVDDAVVGNNVFLGAATGTIFSGNGWLPGLTVNAGSVGNEITGRGLVFDGFAGAGNWGGVPNFTTMDGNILYAGGAASSLKATFSAPVAPSTTNFLNLNTAAGATFTLGANAIMGGDMAHPAGGIDLGGFTLTHLGTAPGMTVGATITNGLLYFSSAATNFTVTGPGTAVIGANFQYADITDNNATQTFTFLSGSTGELQINGTLTLSATTGGGDGALLDIGAGRTLTAGGNITVGDGSSFVATNGGTTGILLLDAVTPPLVWTTPAVSSVTNLTVADDVNLAGGVIGSSLTVGQAAAGAFIHNAGNINIGSASLIIGNANATTFTRNGGTYSGTGWLVWNGNNVAGFQHSAVVAAGPMTVNYLRLDQPFTMQNGRNLNVVNSLHLNNGSLTNATITAASWLHVGDATNVPMIIVNNNFDILTNALIFDNANADYSFRGTAGTASTRVWPAAPSTIPRNVEILKNVGVIETIATSRNINGNLFLTEGTLQWDSPIDLAIASGSTITRDAGGALDKNTNGDLVLGTFTAPLVNLIFTNAVGNTGIEYSDPQIINNVTLGLPVGTTVSINASKTIAGTITWNSVLTFNALTTTNVTLAQTLPTGSGVTNNGTVNWNAGLVVNGLYTNNNVTNVPAGGLVVNGVGPANGYINGNVTTVVGGMTGTGTVTNNAGCTLNLDAYNVTGLTTLNAASIMNMTGNATFAALTLPALQALAPPAAPTAPAVINTIGNLAFTGVFTNNLLNLNFTGTNAQTVALGANRQINNFIVAKGGDQTVSISGGNLTLNPVQNGALAVVHPAGVLTLTRGVVVVGEIVPGTAALFTIQLTTNGGAPGIITNLGYVRNPANNVDLAHVVGRLGVFVPVNTIGRMEWPVGSTTKYRPAALTFTGGNFTIAPTTIIVNHIEQTPIAAGESRPEFPLDGGTKVLGGANWIGSATPYYWMFEATTSLGAAQQFNVELNATELTGLFPSLGNRNHNDLRIIRRFFGNVAANRWYTEGSNTTYTNALYENTPTVGAWLAVVRNIGSMGSAISQQAMFTVGLPTQAPIWTVGGNVAGAIDEATGGVLNTYTTTQTAVDPDVTNSTVNYAVLSVTPAVPADATYGITSAGVFTFKPGWDGGTAAGKAYTFVIQASKAGGDATTKSIVVTVTNSNRVPSFTATGGVGLANASVKYGVEYSTVVNAVDGDGETLTYAIQSVVPALVTAPTISALGKLAFTPVYADLGKAVVITVTATDPNGGVATTTATYTVTAAFKRGDANLSGGEPDVTDAIQILEYVVGKRTFTEEQKSYANADLSAEVPTNPTAYDASFILRYIAANYVWPTSKAVATAGTVEFGKLASQEGSYFLPFNLTNTKGVTSVYAEVNVGTNNVDIKAVTSRLPQDWLVVSNIENGVVKLAAAGVTPLSDGAFATLEMKITNKEAVVNVQGSTMLNDELTASLNAKVREIPSEFALSQNYPNPFNPTTTIKYSIADDVKVSLVVYDMLGQVVKTLVDGQQEAGFYSMKWDGTNEYGSRIASGIYIYRLQAGSFVSTIKMNLMK